MPWRFQAGGEAEALARIGDLGLKEGQPAEANRHLEEALALNRELGHRSGETDALNSLGAVLLASGKPGDASAQHSALDLAERIGDKYQQAHAHDNLGQTYHAAVSPATPAATCRGPLICTPTSAPPRPIGSALSWPPQTIQPSPIRHEPATYVTPSPDPPGPPPYIPQGGEHLDVRAVAVLLIPAGNESGAGSALPCGRGYLVFASVVRSLRTMLRASLRT